MSPSRPAGRQENPNPAGQDESMEVRRDFLKNTIRRRVDPAQTAKGRGEPPPPIETPVAPGTARIPLPAPGRWRGVERVDLTEAISRRDTRRAFADSPLTLDELSFLLWACQGVRGPVIKGHAKRNVPSACCRHPFEVRVAALRVAGLDVGMYRYLPLSNELARELQDDGLGEALIEATGGQEHAGRSAATFIWTVVPARTEWRLGLGAHKSIALDAGHACQNLLLACEAVGAGACPMNGYDQERMDRLLRLDGKEEFAVYLAAVGKAPPGDPRRMYTI